MERALFDPGKRPLERVTAGPGRVAYAGLQQSKPTREPNFDPRKETMCFLRERIRCDEAERDQLTEYDKPRPLGAVHWHG